MRRILYHLIHDDDEDEEEDEGGNVFGASMVRFMVSRIVVPNH